MSYARGQGAWTWHSIDTLNHGPVAPQTTFASGTWEVADQAVYVPVIVRTRVIVVSLWYGNGTTATGNYDIGLYDASGTALLRKGSTTKTTTGAEIVWDCTDTTIGPGLYYLALVNSTNTDTFHCVSTTAPYPAALGVYSEASALPLPATATFAVPQALVKVPLIGMFLNTVVT